jgi:uncharacterized protein with FMN-binding domain
MNMKTRNLAFMIIIFALSCSTMNYNLPKGPIHDLVLKDGTYIGEATWRPVFVRAEVTIKDNKIADIKILKHRHGPSKKFKATGIIPRIIEAQSTQVDAISGATYSSKVISSAVQDAVNKAREASSP